MKGEKVDGVVSPATVEEVQELVKLCAMHKLCLIPRGGGTNVSNMLEVPAEEKRPVVKRPNHSVQPTRRCL